MAKRTAKVVPIRKEAPGRNVDALRLFVGLMALLEASRDIGRRAAETHLEALRKKAR